ncbi:MAG: ABC transporter permease [Chloroflexi bacterium]|nr:ABC transporter permease [Chloroflexota bacterium]MDA1297401.1 ABC transporter permease [Chloroflexota bacterium]
MNLSMQRGLVRRKSAIGLAGLVTAVLLALFAVLTPEVGPGPGDQDLVNRLASPSIAHLMGTDQLGRDQFSRVAAGARNSIATALVVLGISGVGGGLIGLLSGFAGGKTDLLLQRVVDTVMALPLLVLVLAVVAAAGASFWSVALAMAVAFSPLTVRVARSSALPLRGSDFVAAARLSGASTPRIVLRHLVPNAVGPWAIIAASQAGAAVLVESALAFIGAAPGRVTLGGLLGGEAQTYMYGAPWLIIWPGIVLGVLSLSANLIGEWASDRTSVAPGT